MEREEIPEALAALGVPIWARRPVGGSSPDPAEAIAACLAPGNELFRMSVAPLLIALDPVAADRGLRAAREALPAPQVRWLRRLAIAAEYLARVYGSELAFLLGRPPTVPSVFDRSALPRPEEDYGEPGLRALADEIGREEGPEVNWDGSLEDPVRKLIAELWRERRRSVAEAG